MLDLFTTRELAISIYFVLFVIYLFWNKKLRPDVFKLIKSAFQPALVKMFLIVACYGALVTAILSLFPFWKNTYLKDIIIWIVFVGVPVSFSAVNKNSDYYKSMIVKNFAISALLEFVMGTFTFSLIAELIIQPVLTVLIVFQVFSDNKEEYKVVNKFFTTIITIFGFVLIVLTIREIAIQGKQLNKFDLLIAFLTPIFYSIVFVPLAYLIAVYAKYEDIFCMFWFNDRTTEKAIAKSRRKQAIRVCGLSYNKQKQFKKHCAIELTVNSTETDFERVIKDFKGEKWSSKHFI